MVETQTSRHIVPPFNKRKDRGAFNVPDSQMLYNAFPGLLCLSYGANYVHLLMSKLPSKPYPRTIAGIRAYFTTDPRDEGPLPPIKRPGRGRFRLHEDIEGQFDEGKRHQIFYLIRE